MLGQTQSDETHLNVQQDSDRLDPSLTEDEASVKADGHSKLPKSRARFSGWRFGVIAAACGATAICVLNTGILIWWTTNSLPTGGIGTLYDGSCEVVSQLSTGTHVIINILSSILLAGSNYCMQCLAAPTRSECDHAHARRDWLDIGINSFRNLFKIGRIRVLLWLLLAISSFPIHLLYNSVVFKVLSANKYDGVVVNSEFFDPGELWISGSGLFSSCSSHASCVIDIPATRTQYNLPQPQWYWDSLQSVFSQCHFSDCSLNTSEGNVNSHPTLFDIYAHIEMPRADHSWLRYSNGSVHPLLYGEWESLRLWSVCTLANCSVTSGNTTMSNPTYADVTKACNCSQPVRAYPPFRQRAIDLRTRYFEQPDRWTTRSLKDCLADYGNDFVSEWNNVFFVANQVNETAPLVATAYKAVQYRGGLAIDDKRRSSYSWMCEDDGTGAQRCDAKAMRDKSVYTLAKMPIGSCKAERSTPHCKLQFSTSLFIAVVLCNALKATIMFAMVLWKRDAPLTVTGDAIASFLNRPDTETKGRCLLTDKAVRKRQPDLDSSKYLDNIPPPIALAQPTKRGLRIAKSIDERYLVSAFSYIAALLVVVFSLFCMAMSSANYVYDTTQTPWSLGFGAVNPRLTFSGSFLSAGDAGSLLPAVLISNLPQLLVSFAYVMYNYILTAVLLCQEWLSYSSKRKTLRVSLPTGLQRSSYFLHVPYRYGVPLIAASTTLHWLISTAIFVIRVDLYSNGTMSSGESQTSIGYSPFAILLGFLLGVLMVAALVVLLYRKNQNPLMPMAGTNSFAIAASCHPPAEDTDAAFLPIMWGQTDESIGEDVGHCCFTSLAVHAPLAGGRYA